MCGICGYIGTEPISREALSAMNDSMTHRGPDDAGLAFYEAPGGMQVALAHRRLAINDLSPQGHQPMSTPDGSLVVVFNGEIYNFLELREELAGYDWRSACDTEVILAAYRRWGEGCIDHLRGMFAIALYDRKRQTLLFARDRIGKKPFYYWVSGQTFAFASELKPLMRCPGFHEGIRRDVLPRFLYQQYINAPDTIFENVYKLEPGTRMTLRLAKGPAAERLVKLRYWDLAELCRQEMRRPVRDYGEAKEALREALVLATRERMIADVPLGSFLSGGYDSSLISAIAQEISLAEGGRPLKTFSIGFAEEQYDESPYARAVAEHLGTEHTELRIGEEEMFALVESIAQYFDEPFADSSEIPTMLVSSLARRDVTVALSGDGGDEFFCGYNIYDNVRQAQLLDPLGAAAHGVGRLPAGGGKHLEDRYPFRVRVIAANRNPETRTQFGAGSYVEHAVRMVLSDPAGAMLPVNYPVESRYGQQNWQLRRMLLDMEHYLPGDILCKVDRASMKYSLETRCPILDQKVMELSFRIPHAYKYRKGEKKAILRDLAHEYVPKELLDRPKKGFGVPLDKWLRGPLRPQLLAYCDREFLARQGLFDAEYTSRLIGGYLEKGDGGPATGANYSKLSWSFFVFQQWYERYQDVCRS